MEAKQAQKLRNILLIAGIIIMLSAYIYESLFNIGLIVAFSSLIPHFFYNKCPHCGKQLGNNEAAYCQHCGKRIE